MKDISLGSEHQVELAVVGMGLHSVAVFLYVPVRLPYIANGQSTEPNHERGYRVSTTN